MAKRRKRRRPNAGPPPGQRPELVADGAPEGKTEKPASKGPKAPSKPGYQGPVIRAVLVAVLFYPYLVYIAREEPGTALLISVGAFVVMLPAGIALDRIRYRIQMRRYRREIEGSKVESPKAE